MCHLVRGQHDMHHPVTCAILYGVNVTLYAILKVNLTLDINYRVIVTCAILYGVNMTLYAIVQVNLTLDINYSVIVTCAFPYSVNVTCAILYGPT